MKKYFVIMAFVVLLLSACGKKEEGTIGRGKKDDGSQAVMVELLQARDIDEYVNVSGKLEGITDITMSAESSGRILELYKKLGDYVEKGERIGRLENEVSRIRLGQAEAAFNAAETSLENAQKNLDYATLSRQRDLISEAEFNTASAAFKSAKAGFDGANAALEAARQAYENTYLMAPERGRVSYLNVSAGQLINMGSPIATITDASTLLLKTGVGESQIAKIKTGQKAIVNHLGKNYSATVRGFGIRPMQGSSNYPIELVLGGEKSLLPGMVVSAKIKTNTFRDMLYTSITNVLKEFDRNYVFVVEKEGEKSIAIQRDVVLGRSISEYVEIISGVEAGEEIVISGTENLEDGSLVNIRD